MSVVWKKSKIVQVGAAVDLCVHGSTLARVIKRGPKDYDWFPLGHGRKTGNTTTLREAKKAAEQATYEYYSFVKFLLEEKLDRDKRRG